MARIVFVSGGCRSGKSDYALQEAHRIAAAENSERIFVATCPKIDTEMDTRILRHQESRDSKLWRTIEEPYELLAALQSLQTSGLKSVVVDCLSLWVNNLLYRAKGADLTEKLLEESSLALVQAARAIPGIIYFVSSEVGLGLVPENRESRKYRDLLGRVNQTIAREATEAVFLVSGLALKLKG